MNSATLICPHCHHPIPLDEALNARATQVAEARLTEDRAKLESTLAKEFDQKLEQAVKSANEKARVEASKQQSLELRDLENRLKERDRQLDLARDQAQGHEDVRQHGQGAGPLRSRGSDVQHVRRRGERRDDHRWHG